MGAIHLARVNRFLLSKQHLAPEMQSGDVMAAVQDICALHSTAALTPYLSLWNRVKHFQPEQLDHELYETRNLVRLTCMRATLHIVPSDRLPSFFQATKKRQRRSLGQLGYLLVQSGLCREGQEEATVPAAEAHRRGRGGKGPFHGDGAWRTGAGTHRQVPVRSA